MNIWTTVDEGGTRRVYYMWPNFSLFYFGDLAPSRALELFEELDFGTECRTDGAVMDSGACTAPFLDAYGDELGIVDFVRSCSVSYEQIDRDTCNLLADENSIPRATQCTTAYTLESEVLAVYAKCEHVQIPAVEMAWEPNGGSSRLGNGSSSDEKKTLDAKVMEKSIIWAVRAATGEGVLRISCKGNESVFPPT